MLRILEYQSHLASELGHLKILVIYILSVIIYASGVRFYQPIHVLYERGFSGAGVSDKTYELTVRYGKADVF